jgi:uncharacterized protein (TIGR02001 family)
MKRNLLLAVALAGASAMSSVALAQQPSATPAAPTPDYTLTGNANLATDYRFRGISQTFLNPAFQGGFDFSHSSGLYIGNWNSNVSGLSFNNGAGLEMDLYGGYKKTFGDFGFDVGLLQYYYPAARAVSGGTNTKYDTLEVYGAATWKFLTLKYSHTLGNYFGVRSATLGGACNRNSTDCFAATPGSSTGSGYLDLTANYEIMPKLTLTGHIGHQSVRNYGKLNYNDYKLGVVYDASGWLLGAAFITTDADKKWYYITDGSGRTREIGKATVVLSVGKNF